MPLVKKPTSVKGMLLTLLLPAGIGLMAAAWFVHDLLLDRMSRAFIENRLKEEVTFLEHRIRGVDGRIQALQGRDYFFTGFHHAFAIRTPERTIVSPQAWEALLKPLTKVSQEGAFLLEALETTEHPSDVFAYRRSFNVDGAPIVVIVSKDLEPLKRSQAELHAWTAVISVLLILLLVVVIWLGITLSLRPVTILKASLGKLQDGEIARINVPAPDEFQPLVLQLNQLLDSLDKRLERSREALANLSHSIKTPIAAVRQVLEDTDRPLPGHLRRLLAVRLSEINSQLEAEMRRSHFAGPQIGKTAFPIKQARDLLWMLGRLYPEKSFELSSSLTEESRWPMEEHDLNEVLGNLLDNAGKWSSQCVELSFEQGTDFKRIVVIDDGQGVKSEDLTSLGHRGTRLDEQTPGHGLGLAIVRDIVARYKGDIRFSSGPHSGLRVTITF